MQQERLLLPVLAKNNDVRFLAAMAATKLGRGDQLAAEVTRLGQLLATTASRPTVVEHAVALYARWRGELESDYVPDWSGLEAVLRRGDEH